jgi:rfaE bifunctional protein kinase chain/domain
MNALKNSIIQEKRFFDLLEGFSSIAPVMVVGDIGIDKYTRGIVQRISPEAPVPVLEVSDEWFKLGLAANVSENLKDLGVRSALCGVIGDDSRGDIALRLLEKEGHISSRAVMSVAGRPTICKERIVTSAQQICRIDYEIKEPIAPEQEEELLALINEDVSAYSALIIEDYGKGLITELFVRELIKKFVGAGKMVAVDPSRTTSPWFYKGATLLKPNFSEAQIMANAMGYPEKKLEKIAEVLIDKLALSQIVVTLGSEGMALMDVRKDKNLRYIPTVASEVFDVSGAGDTVISALTAAIAAGASLEEAAWIGNCAAGVVVAKKGTATVSRSELGDFYFRLLKKFQ